MPPTQPNLVPVPLTLRFAGLWLIWSAWCSASGWLLSAVHELDGLGYVTLLPVLFGCSWFWLKSTAHRSLAWPTPLKKSVRRLRQPASFVYFCIVLLSLVAGSLYVPWSFDAATYRLPRVLYWWSAHHWYWIGTLDHRLDYSSVGFEWQILPLMQLARSDRLVFLVNWIPFLLMPGLVFSSFRAFGVSPRSARRWMWLLPAGCCFALQCSGAQNDAFAVNFLLAAIALADLAARSRRGAAFWLALLAMGLMTGAKLSNAPLLLPTGVLLWSAMKRVSWFNWKLVVIGFVTGLCSFVPLAFLAWQATGDWTGDPADQWHIRPHHVPGSVVANLVVLAQDVTQPPLLPGSEELDARLRPFNESGFVGWLRESHGDFTHVKYGTLPYEGVAGPGFGLALYVIILLGGSWFFADERKPPAAFLPWAWRLAPWLAWVSYGILLVKIGSCQSPRIAAPYYPLLLVPLLRCPRVAAWERKKAAGVMAVVAAATVLPAIILTPARPLVPVQTIAQAWPHPALEKVAAEYRTWDILRDDLAPLRVQLPPGTTQLGYGGGLRDTSYGLFQPPGSRTIVELGLPLGTGRLPPPGLSYAVVTPRGIYERYQFSLETWLERAGGAIIFTNQRQTIPNAHGTPQYEPWYLVKLNPAANRPPGSPPN